MNNKILVVGNFGYRTNNIGGQTIKTREVYTLLECKLNTAPKYFDVERITKNPLTLLHLLYLIFRSDQLVYLPGKANLKKIFPLIHFICKYTKKNIILITIGSWMSKFLSENRNIEDRIRSITVILVETKRMKMDLEMTNKLANIEILHNFRIVNSVKKNIATRKPSNIFKIVFMARVTEEKGIYKLIAFADYIFNQTTSNNYLIDFFGPIDPKDKNSFFAKIKKYPFIEYKGMLDPKNIVEIISEYDVLILPTHHPGEGFPGSIVDAYISGLPVIVSNWKHLPEFVEHGKTGFIFDNEEELFEQIITLASDNQLLLQMKKNAYKKSKEYSHEVAWNILKPYLK